MDPRPGQRTLKTPCRLEGVGLHSGRHAAVVLEPAADNQGIHFVRGDIPGATPLPATIRHVVETPLSTTIGTEHWQVGTIEHLMAALAGCEVDNVTVVVHGPEIPILDGSARPFVEAIDAAGLLETTTPRRCVRLTTAVSVRRGASRLDAFPSPRRRWACTIAFDHPKIGRQFADVTPDSFRAGVAPARTFGLLDDVSCLRKQGYARGGTLKNALVMGKQGWVNADRVRFQDEPVRHKLLDLIGDSMLLGAPLIARLEAWRPGHALTHRLLRRIQAAQPAVIQRITL